MTDTATFSRLRRRLCSYEHAARVAAAMAEAGAAVVITSTGDVLQPWRIVDSDDIDAERSVLACA